MRFPTTDSALPRSAPDKGGYAMAARVRIHESGWAALRAQVQRAGDELAAEIGHDASRFAPVRTGALRSSVYVEQTGEYSWRIGAGRGLPDARALYNELGTRHMAAQPFIRPAAYRRRAI